MRGPCKKCSEIDHLVPIFDQWYCDTCYLETHFTQPKPKRRKPNSYSWYKGLRRKLFVRCPICLLCGGQIKFFDEASFDHIHPRALGGRDEPVNLQLAHKSCNQAKGMMPPLEYLLRNFVYIIH